jgi:predicted phage baseplate assembly protein
VVENRPGLAEIAYRSGTYDDFRASMIAGLSRTDRPALAGLRTRDANDPTIALLDSWAVACDVLTFYTERLAHESYLGTATERTSLQELGKLLAYRLSLGVAAGTHLAFSLERPPAPPPLDPPDPGLVPASVPAEVVLPTRLRVTSVPGPGEQPQTFETVEAVAARPEWNALPVARTTPHLPTMNRVDAWLAGTDLNLAKGDAILFASSDLVNDRWDVRLITDVEVDLPGERTHVRWEYGLGSINPFNEPAAAPQAFVLRKRTAVFGHNAPIWKTMIEAFRNGYRAQFDPQPADGPEWPFFVAVTTSGGHTQVDLDGSHPDIVRDSWVVLSQDTGPFYRELYRVVERAELSRSAFGVSGKVTRLTLEGEAYDFKTPRDVTVLAVSEPLTVVEAPDHSTVSGSAVVVDGDATELPVGRTVLVTGRLANGESASDVVVVASADTAPGGRTALTFTTALTHSYQRDSTLVLGNVARATHGETVTAVLGSGDARSPFQTFALQQGPLTFVPATNPRGAESTLEVTVDDVRWAELPSTYQAGARDRVYVTRDEPDGTVSVVFGDGIRGARPSSGAHNVRARYRKGIGAAGNVGRDTLTQPLDRPLGVKGVTNPAAATGGVDPEAPDHARRSIPLPVRTLGRAVSLLDYADFALAFTGIGKATAQVLPLRGGRTIVVSVADASGAPPPANTVTRLAEELTAAGDPNTPVRVVPCRIATFRVAVKVAVDPDREPVAVLAAVEQRLREVYRMSAREIRAPVHRSAVIATASSVVGVTAVDLDRCYKSGTSSHLALRLLAEPAHAVHGLPRAAELLGLTEDPFDWLEEMP